MWLESSFEMGCKYVRPLEVRDRIAVKRKLRKRWQLTRDPRLKTEMNRVTQDLRRTIIAIKQQSIAAYLQELTDDASTDYSLWKATTRLKRPVMSIPPLRKPDRTWAKDDKVVLLMMGSVRSETC
jgi:hypothetical protein